MSKVFKISAVTMGAVAATIVVIVLVAGPHSKIINYFHGIRGAQGSGTGELVAFVKSNSESTSDVKDIQVTIRQIELQKSDGTWLPLFKTSTTTSLLPDGSAKNSLGSLLAYNTEVPSAAYTSTRYTFGDVNITKEDGTKILATLPSPQFTIVSDVNIKDAATSTVTLTFLTSQSIYNEGTTSYLFVPKVTLETHSEAEMYVAPDTSAAVSFDSGKLDNLVTAQMQNDDGIRNQNQGLAVNTESDEPVVSENAPVSKPTDTPVSTNSKGAVAAVQHPSPKPVVSPTPTQNIVQQQLPKLVTTLVFTPISNQNVTAGQPVAFSVLASDSAKLAVTYAAVTLPSGASFDPSTGAFTWTPQITGSYTVIVSATDGTITTNQTISLVVSAASQGVNSGGGSTPGIPEPDPTPQLPAPVVIQTYAYTWSPSGQTDNMYSSTIMPHLVPMVWLSTGSNDFAGMKSRLDAMPAGHHVAFNWDLYLDLGTDPSDECTNPHTSQLVSCAWWDNGAGTTTGVVDQYFNNLSQVGAPIDYVVLDDEQGMSMWLAGWAGSGWLSPEDEYENSTLYAIASDPRYPDIHQLLLNMGYNPASTLHDVYDWRLSDGYLIFNEVMQERAAQYMNQSVFDPMKRYYPNVQMSNFGYDSHSLQFPVPEINGHKVYKYGPGSIVGTAQSPVEYGSLGFVKDALLDGTNVYGVTPFNAFRYDVNDFRSAVLSSSTPANPWIAFKGFDSSLKNSDYYQEMVFHLLLSGSKDLLYWNPAEARTDPQAFGDDILVNNILEEYDSLTQGTHTTLVNALIPWDSSYVVSGMQVGSNSIWRFTPSLGLGDTLQSILSQDGDSVVFQIGLDKITFPHAHIVTPTQAVSSLGYWIAQDGTEGYHTDQISFFQNTFFRAQAAVAASLAWLSDLFRKF